MSSTTTTTTKVETPFTSGAVQQDAKFWSAYIASRPHPSEDFFRLIQDYHTTHGNGATKLAHDVGTGPGNIAERLLRYYDHVVGSDLNGDALAAAPQLIPSELTKRLTFVQSRAEELANSEVVPKSVGAGQTDLITVSECIPLLDYPLAVKAFHTLLRPQGTVAIYFYGRPIFTGGQNSALLNDLYDRVATRICQFLLPFKGTPGFPFHQRGAEALISYLDNIAMPSSDWTDVVRYKYNSDVPLLFNSKDGYDFEFEPVDRRESNEKTVEVQDHAWWKDEWDADRVRSYLDSVYPSYVAKAGSKISEVDQGVEELRKAMGGAKVAVTFPVALILATKK